MGFTRLHTSDDMTMQCVSIDAKSLTRRGWLAHDEVQVGDETIGYNPTTGRSEWTPITEVVHYEAAPIWRIGNGHWHVDVSPGHLWWSETERVLSPESATFCPECGYTSSPRGVSTHRGRIHRVRTTPITEYRGEFVHTHALSFHHRIRVAAPADTDGFVGLNVDEVAVIAWLQGDGHLRPVLAKPETCPECGWTPGHRKLSRGPIRQPANAVAVHRAKLHGLGKAETIGTPAGWDGTIYQSKPQMVTKLRSLLVDVPHGEGVRHRGGNTLPAHAFRLARSYVSDVMKRAEELPVTDPETFILRLSPEQRAAWLAAMVDAEGHRMPGKKAHHREHIRIAQVNGPLADAIRLAIYLEGWRPTFNANSAERRGYQPAGTIGLAGAHVAPSMFNKHQVLPNQTVWCVQTSLGTWTAEQHGQVFLTGTSITSTEELR